MRSSVAAVVVVVAALAPLACARADLFPTNASRGGREGASTTGGHNVSAPSSGSSTYVGALSNGAPVCSGGLAASTFGYGLCVCGDAAFAGDLHVHGLDANTPGAAGANGDWSRAGTSTIDGDLVVGGQMAGAGDDDIGGNLDVGTGFSQAGEVAVGGDARVGGDAVAAGVATVGGSLTVPDDAFVFGVASASVVRADVDVASPCDCGDTSDTHVDVQGFIAEARAANDDAAAGIDPAGFVNAGAVDLDLAPGRYFVEELTQAGAVTLHVTGAVEFFVAGDVSTAGDIDVELADANATLDFFVGGDVASAGVFHFGDGTRADAVRLYVDGAGGVAVAGDEQIDGALFLPHGTLASAGDLRVNGAVVAADLAAAGVIDIGFAGGLLTGDGGDCTAPGADDGSDNNSDGNNNGTPGTGGTPEVPPQG